MARVLVVDDEEGMRRTLRLFLESAGHQVEVAGDTREALERHRDECFDVVVTDILMPGENGLTLVDVLRLRCPFTQFVLITGQPSVETAAEAVRLRAFDYLPKPVRRESLCRVVGKAASEKDLREANARLAEENRRHREELEVLVEERTRELRNLTDLLQVALDSTTIALSKALELRDPYTAGHQRRVADLACRVWDRLSLAPGARDGLRISSLLHDLGKLRVPSDILAKPSRLSPSEFELIKEHPVAAWEILRLLRFPWPVATIVRQHHERMDGSGYPDGVSDGEILPEARVLGVADVVEAMAYHRPYRPALGIQAALAEIQQGSGTRYWPDAVEACVSVFRDEGFSFSD